MLTGKAGVGKDTYLSSLIEKHGDAPSFAFADPIKDICTYYGGWDGRKDERGRTLLQELGQVLVNYDKYVWARLVADEIEGHLMPGKENLFFITDLRYNHEYEFMRYTFPEAEISVLRLHREYDSKLTEEQQQHSSEQGIKDEYVTEEIYL